MIHQNHISSMMLSNIPPDSHCLIGFKTLLAIFHLYHGDQF